jgi:hypothetical protein
MAKKPQQDLQPSLLNEDERQIIMTALEHYCAYLRAVQRDSSRCVELLERLRK